MSSLPDPSSSEFVVEVFYDHEVGQWFYTVDALNIISTGRLSKQAAERYAQKVIEFTLEEIDH